MKICDFEEIILLIENNEKLVINCSTPESNKSFLKAIKEVLKVPISENCWELYKEDTCFCIKKKNNKKLLVFGEKNRYEKSKYTIVQWTGVN